MVTIKYPAFKITASETVSNFCRKTGKKMAKNHSFFCNSGAKLFPFCSQFQGIYRHIYKSAVVRGEVDRVDCIYGTSFMTWDILFFWAKSSRKFPPFISWFSLPPYANQYAVNTASWSLSSGDASVQPAQTDSWYRPYLFRMSDADHTSRTAVRALCMPDSRISWNPYSCNRKKSGLHSAAALR